MEASASRLVVNMMQGVAVVHFTDAKVTDQRNINQIGEELMALIEKSNVRKMVINLDSVQYLSSAVLGKLISLHKALRMKKGALKLCHIAPPIYEVFEITRLNRVFDICRSEAEAVESFRLGGSSLTGGRP